MFKFILPKFLINVERWKWNDEYRVYVSNTGRFKDEYKKEIPVKISSGGYCMIKTYVGFKSAHRLVMMTWRPTRDMENLTVDHLDHNKRNNTLTNLEWVTEEENTKRALADFVNVKDEKDKNRNINTNINTDYKLTFGKKRKFLFDNYHEAAVWWINNQIDKNDRDVVKVENIEKRIKNATETKKLYYNYRWKWVQVNEEIY